MKNQNPEEKWSSEQRRRILLGVFQRLHGQMASIATRRLCPETTPAEHKSMTADAIGLEDMIRLLNSGEDLQTTTHPRLKMMRDLVVGGLTCMLPDGEYVLTEGRAWFRCGPTSILIAQNKEKTAVSCTVYPLKRETSNQVASCATSYEAARRAVVQEEAAVCA